MADISAEDYKLLQKIALAEAGGEGTLGMALVVRSILNRSAIISTRSGGVTAGTYLSKSGSIRDVIYGKNQFQPVSDGSINKARTAAQLNQASEAIKLATDTNALNQALQQDGKTPTQVRDLMSATGFRAGYAFDDASHNYKRIGYKNHIFNSDQFASKLDVPKIYASVWGGASLPSVDNSAGSTGDVNSVLGNSAGQAANTLNALGGIITANIIGTNCPPPPFTQQDRIIYVGCSTKVQGAVAGGSIGAGAAAGSVAANGMGENTALASGPNQIYSTPKKGMYVLPVVGEGKYILTSPFGYRIHPISRVKKFHSGIDLASFGQAKLPIVACADGTTTVKNQGRAGYGNYVDVKHVDGSITRYGHLHKVSVKSGQTVKQGEQIGLMGTTGRSTGVHLHFEIILNGKAVDPLPYLPPVKKR